MNPTFAEDILAEAEEPIIGIRISKFEGFYSEINLQKEIPPEYLDKVITWKQAKPFLDYSYETGFGSMDCHNIVAWTANKVLYIHEYDGSTQVRSLPRNPT